jgi:hypothetical protein
MNTIVKLSVAGALALGAYAANASTGSSDAILFAEVLNGTTVVASYAGDTGVSINSAFAGTSTTALAGDANLAALFKADVTGDTLMWAVEGGQYTASTTTAVVTPGVAQFVTTATNTANITGKTNAALAKWATGLGNTVPTLNTNLAGGNSVEGTAAATAGVWDFNTPSGVSSWYSNGPATNQTALGTAENLYSVTGAGGTQLKNLALVSNGTVSLTSAGLVFATASTSAVPLPGAVWLFGSGLLGLAGVSRRKAIAAV